ncbi:MAG: type II toxin-antitoxin system HipA family toxin [Candidatus Marinimicrobia bacterium]|nr:type II toxin-antitoxin system HipA family toxin [Candidatus Neomarinimicrobiota bacterium]
MVEKVNILNIFAWDQPMGRMVITNENVCVFEYDSDYLSTGKSLSPFHLPIRPGAITARRDPFNGCFGVFNDSLPDGWGNLLIDRFLISQNIRPNSLSILDRLSIVGQSGMGVLTYEPVYKFDSITEINDLNILAAEVEKILAETQYESGILSELVEMGGSSGGARPKVMLNINGEPWIVKFKSTHDPDNMGEVEYQYSIVAKKCGIEMPETKLLEGKYFGVKRFDREDEQKIHIHSASGLLYADHRFPSLDYVDLIKAAFVLTKNIEEAYKLFRLMAFNILTGNKDDHAKNFSFIFKKGQWLVSPAYDLVPSDGYNGNHSTTILGKGRAAKNDILEVAKLCNLNQKKAELIFDMVYVNCKEIRIKGFE